MTPEKKDPAVIRLLKIVKASHEEEFLMVEPEEGAKELDCFPIVQQKVKIAGGKMILGWQIWKSKNLAEAEAHAVWEDTDGELHDITPKGKGITQILFAEDDKLKYEGKQIETIRINLTSNRLIDDYIDVCKALFKFYNKGDRAMLYDLSAILTPKELDHLEYLDTLKKVINNIIFKHGNRKSLCGCTSGILFKDCHGLDMAKRIQADI